MDTESKYTSSNLLHDAENESTYFMAFNDCVTRYGNDTIYCFVENYDQFFYPHRVKDITGKDAEGIPCDGKKNVIAIFKIINSKPEYNKYHTLYFVDADFDDNSHLDKRIYYTHCYSIENFYVKPEVMSRVFETEYHIRRLRDKEKFENVVNLYNKELASFHEAVLLFNAWYKTVKDKGLTKDNHVNLDESLPSGFINLQIGNLKSNYDLGTIREKFPNAPQVDEQEIQTSQDYLRQDFGRLRGKYEIQFIDVFLQYLNSDAKGQHLYNTDLQKGINVPRKNIIAMFDHYVDTPKDMRAYILSGER